MQNKIKNKYDSFIVLPLYMSSGDSVQIYVLERELVALAQMEQIGRQTVTTWVFLGRAQVRDVYGRRKSVATIRLERRDSFERGFKYNLNVYI